MDGIQADGNFILGGNLLGSPSSFPGTQKRHVDRGRRPCSTTSYKDHSINGSSHLSDELAGRIMPKKAYSYVACWSAKSASQVSVKKCCPSALQYTSS